MHKAAQAWRDLWARSRGEPPELVAIDLDFGEKTAEQGGYQQQLGRKRPGTGSEKSSQAEYSPARLALTLVKAAGELRIQGGGEQVFPL